MGEVWDSSVLSRAEGLVKVGKYTEGRRRLPSSRGGVSFDVRFYFVASVFCLCSFGYGHSFTPEHLLLLISFPHIHCVSKTDSLSSSLYLLVLWKQRGSLVTAPRDR